MRRLTYLAKIAFLAMRYRLSKKKEENFWDWCFSDLIRMRDKKGRCDKQQLHFLAADAMAQGKTASLEKLMYYFHCEVERDFSAAFQLQIVEAMGVTLPREK